MPRSRSLLLAATAALALSAPSPAHAQQPLPFPAAAPRPSRFSVGLDAVVMDPRSGFGRNVSNVGFGIGGHATLRLDPAGILSLRVDAAGTQYGSETTQAETRGSPYRSPFGGRVGLDVETRNSLSWFGIGPELSLPLGFVRPYVNASIAYARFSTVSDLRGDGYDEYGNFGYDRRLASSQNQSDGASARAAGAGLYIPIGPRRWLADAHVGVRYYDGAQASYLREGSITDNADGTISFTPLRSRTPFVAYQAGLTVTIPRSTRR